MVLDQATKDAMDAEFAKVGETGAKLLNGIVNVLGNIGSTLAPILERIATAALAAFMQAAVDRILKKNGIDPAAVSK